VEEIKKMDITTRVRLAWNSAWVRKGEFHRSLNIDERAVSKMTPEQQTTYREGLLRRRSIAHTRGIERF